MITNVCMNISLSFLPLAVHTIIFNTRQLVLMLLAYIFLKESLSFFEVFAMIVSLVAVIMITLNGATEEAGSPYSATTTEYIIGVGAAVTVVLAVSTWLILLRSLKDTNHVVIQLYQNTITWVFLGIIMLTDWLFFSHKVPYSSIFAQPEGAVNMGGPFQIFGLLCVAGLLAFLAQSIMMICN